jgi:hypothetical protein
MINEMVCSVLTELASFCLRIILYCFRAYVGSAVRGEPKDSKAVEFRLARDILFRTGDLPNLTIRLFYESLMVPNLYLMETQF